MNRKSLLLALLLCGVGLDMRGQEPGPGLYAVSTGIAVYLLNRLAKGFYYLTVKYPYLANAYGIPVERVAGRYDIPRGRDRLILKLAAMKHTPEHDKDLKDILVLLNEALLGKNWRAIRDDLVQDFVDMGRIRFIARHGAEMRERILSLMNIYGATGSLYFKTYDPRTYFQPYLFTTSKGKQTLMYRLDTHLKIVS